MALIGGTDYAGTRRVMVFIDGDYLRKGLVEMFGDDTFNYSKFAQSLNVATAYGKLYPELVRAYYYDAIAEDKNSEIYMKQEEYLRKIKDFDYFQVRLGSLKVDGNSSPRMKGVDTLIAIDMVSKAYEHHYDAAVLVSGDEDLLEVVNAVKDTGNKVFGAYIEGGDITQELIDSFDKSWAYDKGKLAALRS